MSTDRDLCFDADWYLNAYGDVAQAKIDPLTHYLKAGRFEGRKPCQPADALQMQAWETARRAAFDGQWTHALAVVMDVNLFALRHPDATLLALEILTIAGEFEAAQHALKAAYQDFGPLPALALAQSNLISAKHPNDDSWIEHLKPAFPRKTSLFLANGSAPLLDRLKVRPLAKVRAIRPLPKVTVIVPVLNSEATLDTALNSLISQTWENLEILVVDNGSTDASATIAQAFSKRDPRVTTLDAADDPGAYPARNMGVAAATGDFITVQDADDWAHPDKINQHVKALRKTPKAQASLSDWARATSDLRFTNTRSDVGLIHPNISSLMIRADLRDSLGYWDRVHADADTEYHRRIISAFGPKAVVPVMPGQLLSIGRHHEGSLTQSPGITLDDEASNPRKVYQANAAEWHRSDSGSFMPQYPDARPFPAPAQLTDRIKAR